MLFFSPSRFVSPAIPFAPFLRLSCFVLFALAFAAANERSSERLDHAPARQVVGDQARPRCDPKLGAILFRDRELSRNEFQVAVASRLTVLLDLSHAAVAGECWRL